MRDHSDMAVADHELSGCLRSWRERLTPAHAGLPTGTQRRVPGLRREEVAHLAGVSVDYLARLEQNRSHRPSPSVLASPARALRLTDDERSHLFRLAGQAEPGPGTIDRHITPSLHRLLDRLADVPVLVVDAASEIVAANPLAAALIGGPVRCLALQAHRGLASVHRIPVADRAHRGAAGRGRGGHRG